MFFSYLNYAFWIRQLAVLFIFAASPSWASAIPQFYLSDHIESQSLPTLHWADTSKVATPLEAKAALVTGDLVAAGFLVPLEDASHWFAVTLANPTNHTINFSIYVKQASLSTVNLHYKQPSLDLPQDKWVSLFSGADIPLHQRPVNTLLPAFNISLAPNQDQTYYLEIHRKIQLDKIDIKIEHSHNSSHFDLPFLVLVSMSISAALALSLINILMFFSFRDKVYLYFSAYTVSFTLTVMFTAALDLLFELPIIDRSILYLTYNLLAIFFSLFVGEVLDAKRTMPWLHHTLRVSRVIMVILAGLIWYDGSLFIYTFFATLLLSLLILSAAIYAAFVGKASARLLAIGIIVFLSGVIVSNLTTWGFIPSNLVSDNAALFGALIEMVLFSMVLFKRVLSLNESQNAANLALLHISQEAKAVLEKTVNERTLELQKKTKFAEQANNARGQFLTTINHEMRTPLNGILGMVEMLQRKQSTLEQEQQLGHLGAASRQLAGLIDDVLDFSKIDANLIVIQAEDFSTHNLVEDLTGLFSLSAKEKGIDLSFQLETGVSKWLRGDMPHLKQILVNLISNAMKFTEHGEVRLVISSGQLSKSLSDAQANLITFEVSDTGCGIEQTQLEHILLPYYQLQDPLKDSLIKASKVGYTGTGLGLSISEGLIKAMGGSLIVTSELGHGSRFSFTLPLPAAIKPDKKPSDLESKVDALDEALNCFAGINILLVEDSPINQNVMTIFLQETGAKISICDTGTSAVKHFKDHGADLILMDYRLPDTNGLAATQTIRAYEQQRGGSECPIIMHTADNRSSLRDEAQSAGIDLLLPKPFTQAQIINVISQALGISIN